MESETNYELCGNYFDISTLLTLIQSPTVSSGTFEVCSVVNQLSANNNNSSGSSSSSSSSGGDHVNNTMVVDYNIYIDGQECGTIFQPNLNQIERLETEYQKKNRSINDSCISNISASDNDSILDSNYRIDSTRFRVPFFDEQHRFFNKRTKSALESYSFYSIESKNIHINKENTLYDYRLNQDLNGYQAGVYIMALGSSLFEGGEIEIYDSNGEFIQEIKVETYPHEIKKNFYSFSWLAFRNDCSHKIKPITKGTRVLLELRIVVTNPRFIKFRDEQEDFGEFYQYKEPLQYSIKDQFYTLNYKINLMDRYLSVSSLYLDSLVQKIGNLMKERDVNIGVVLNHFYKSNVSESELQGTDLVICGSFNNAFGANNVGISSFIIGESWVNRDINGEEDDEYLNIKISKLTSKEINQLSTTGLSLKKTLMFSSGGTNTFQSIFKSPRGTGDVYDYIGCFSAIVIQNNTPNIQSK